MEEKQEIYQTRDKLEKELEETRHQLAEAQDTIEAIRTGQIDALVVNNDKGVQLFTLKSADQTYRFFIEKMAEGAVTLNTNGVILYSNTQFARMAGVPLTKVIGVSFEAFVADESKVHYQQIFKTGFETDFKGELQLKCKNFFIPVQLSVSKLYLEKGASLSIIVTDLTAQKAAQLQLRAKNEQLAEINIALESSNHDLQQFASVASHDLQEPVRKIQIFSNILKDKKNEFTPETITYLEKIILSAGRMRSLIVDILTYSRLSADHNYLEVVNLNEVINELLEDFELIIHDKKAKVIVNDLVSIEANKGQLRQVFQNIISNSLKFSIPGEIPVIEIKSVRIEEKSFKSKEDKDGNYCLISVKDNGIGFDEKYLTNIFALFERLNSKDNYEGSGIGMAIAKKVIDKHYGLITASSKNGQGTEFKIILPITQTPI